MVFHNIFNTAQSASEAGVTAGGGIFGYIPKEPIESTCVPPHDPMQPVAGGPQDPKIVRETAPQAQSVFNLVNALIGAVKQAAEQQDIVTRALSRWWAGPPRVVWLDRWGEHRSGVV